MRFHYDDLTMLNDPVEVGQERTLIECHGTLTGDTWYRLGGSSGVGGNTDNSIRRYHGWRGTTNAKATYACGLRRIEAIRKCKTGGYTITVSRDLHPAWP